MDAILDSRLERTGVLLDDILIFGTLTFAFKDLLAYFFILISRKEPSYPAGANSATFLSALLDRKESQSQRTGEAQLGQQC